MGLFELASILVTVAAFFSYLNHRFFKLPTTIGLMLAALVLSGVLILLGHLNVSIYEYAERILKGIDFNETLMHGMLGFLLFAGALHVNINDLISHKWVISILATVGVLLSTFLVGTGGWWIFNSLGFDIPYIYCLLFGALISPTDPIAVLSILKLAKAPKSLETKMAGESLFNDGVGVVIFLVLFGLAKGGSDAGVTQAFTLFVKEAIGGAIYGFVIGYGAYRMLKSIDNYHVEVLITLALVMGGYCLAYTLHTSGPIAMVVAGLLIGNQGRKFAMSEKTRQNLDTFWELIDEILNAVLFVLIGLEMIILTFNGRYIIAAALAIPLVLLARFLCVGITVSFLRLNREFSPHVVKVLTWGGLRGGISVALALSLPQGPHRPLILAVTYAVVVFSIVVQGLSFGKLIKTKVLGESK